MTLLIMAAGLGSRYGTGIKQLESVGANGEIIMDYSIHDAIEAGFDKIIFVIRKDIEDDFKNCIGNRIKVICEKYGVEVSYVFQEIANVPEGIEIPIERVKPWGTVQAVLSAADEIKDSFVVINADDYYGKKAFHKMYHFLSEPHAMNEYCMAGFLLKNALSENGLVTRGICNVENGKLVDIVETKGIGWNNEYDSEAVVSMNMWGFPMSDSKGGCQQKVVNTDETSSNYEDISCLEIFKNGFRDFLSTHTKDELLSVEYLLPVHIGNLLRDKRITVKVLETDDEWIGITYKEDIGKVKEKFKQMIENGVYGEELYE